MEAAVGGVLNGLEGSVPDLNQGVEHGDEAVAELAMILEGLIILADVDATVDGEEGVLCPAEGGGDLRVHGVDGVHVVDGIKHVHELLRGDGPEAEEVRYIADLDVLTIDGENVVLILDGDGRVGRALQQLEATVEFCAVKLQDFGIHGSQAYTSLPASQAYPPERRLALFAHEVGLNPWTHREFSLRLFTMDELVKIFHALGDETRWRIVQLSFDDALCVCELAEILNMPQSSVSSHLQVIRKAGLLDSERCEKWNYYRVASRFKPLIQAFAQELNATPSSDSVLARDAKRSLKRIAKRQATCCPGPKQLISLSSKTLH